jgi:lipoprotein-anchoring transpeptidase ErfK/SrfK
MLTWVPGFQFETPSDTPVSSSVIGMAAHDAEWLYKQLKVGHAIVLNWAAR